MAIRRYVLITIPLACLIIIFVSLIVYRPTENKESQSQKQKETPAPTKKSLDRSKNSDTIRQSVEELSMPSYDEKGKEVLVLRGENTILLNDNVYKIIAPEIEVMDSTDTESGTQTILITSDKGEMNNVSREGYLSDNVVVHFDSETKLNTDYLRYLPNKNMVYTDNPVTILGNGTKITGEGCEIDLINKKMWIKKDVVMEMGGMKNDPFFMPDKSPKQESETSSEDTVSAEAEAADAKEAKEVKTEKTVIRSSGQLVFEKQVDAQILTFNDQVVMKIGATTVFSDKLIIYIDPATKQAKQSIAIGSVLASQEGKIAKGNMLTWDVNTQSATLEDDHQAEFVQEGMNLYAAKMIFYTNIGRIDVPAAGTLQVEPKKKGKAAGNAEESDVDVINIAWEGRMAYVSDAREATFEKDVAVRREDSILSCNHLKVKLSDHDDSIMSLKGLENVHIIKQKEGGLVSEAVGDQVVWNVKNKISILRGYPFVILKDGENRQIFSPKVVFYEDGHNMLCEGEGSLYEKADKLHSQDEAEAENEDLKVKWLKKMFYNAALRKASFYEGVEATKGGERLDSDQMDAYFDGNQKMTKLIAAGNVYFLSKNLDGNEGLGSFLTWDFIQNTALLTGKPKAELRKGGSRTFSEEVYFNMAKNQITWEGSPHWQVIDKQQSGK